MARTFTQKHYIAVADAIVQATQWTRPDDHEVLRGISRLRNSLTSSFNKDSEKFDIKKFDNYISKNLLKEEVTRIGDPSEDAYCDSETGCNSFATHYNNQTRRCDQHPLN